MIFRHGGVTNFRRRAPGRRSLETTNFDKATRAREKDEALAWNVRIANSMTVARPFWRGEAGSLTLLIVFIGNFSYIAP